MTKSRKITQQAKCFKSVHLQLKMKQAKKRKQDGPV